MASRIQVRRDLAAAWTGVNPILAEGEVGLEIDTNFFKFGDGVTPWVDLSYFSGDGFDPADLAELARTGQWEHIQNRPVFANVATSGLWDHIQNRPTIGTAAAVNLEDLATAAQGTRADTAIQPAALNSALIDKADLDSNGHVPVDQLPSFVSDVIEVASYDDLPATGESGNIYVTINTNKSWRWTGSTYVEIGDGGVGLGTTPETAHRGDHGVIAYQHVSATGNPHDTAPADIGAATAAQGDLADTAVQPGDLSPVASTGDYGDLNGTPTLGTAASADTDDFATVGLADSAIEKVEDGDLFMAAGGRVGTAWQGGVIRDNQSVQSIWDYAQSSDAQDAAVGTAHLVRWDATLTGGGALGPQWQTSWWGPRGVFNIEGWAQQSINGNVIALAPLGYADMLMVGNVPGTSINMTPAWTYLAARLWRADNGTVTALANDTNAGGASYADHTSVTTTNGGEWDGSAVDLTSYHVGSAVVGNVKLRSRWGMHIEDLHRGDDPTFHTPTKTYREVMVDQEHLGGHELDPDDIEVGVVGGIKIDRLTRGENAVIGIQNASTTVEPAQLLTATGGGNTLTITASYLEQRGDDTLTYTSIAPGVEGQMAQIRKLGEGILSLTTATVNVALGKGSTVTLRYANGAWGIEDAYIPWVTTIDSIGTRSLEVRSATPGQQVSYAAYVGSEVVPRAALASSGIALTDGTDYAGGSAFALASAGVVRLASIFGNNRHTLDADVAFTPGDAANWEGSPPTTVGQALDRIAALIADMGAPIP